MRVLSLMAFTTLLLPLGSIADEPKSDDITFAEHIAPLVFDNCTTCHRPGQVAPFSLMSYADVRKRAKTMLQVMEERYMPPWQPKPGHGNFRDSRRLTDSQIAMFDRWVKAGTPEGDPLKTPAPPKFTDGWQLGQPDLIVKMDRAFEVPAEGPDIYQNFVIPLDLSEDKWVTAVEFQATAPEVLHHILFFLDDSGRARAKNPIEGQPGFPGMGFRPTGSLGGWAVGATPLKLPEGLAYPAKHGSDLVLQTHFHLSGKPEKEVITVGLYFADKAPERTLVSLPLPPAFGLFSGVDIPAGKSDFKITDSFTLPVDIDVVSVGGHAHYIGKTLKASATLPDRRVEELFFIDDWDFNWQGQYLYTEFVRLPKGTVITSEIVWDNSAENPRNPSYPPVRIHWGEGSTDEMGAINFRVLASEEKDAKKLQAAIRSHGLQTILTSRLRGDRIDWDRIGLPTPPFWNQATPPDAIDKDDGLDDQDRIKENPPLSLKDIDGKSQSPLLVRDAKANVLFFTTTDCPIANSYSPEIMSIVNDFADKPIQFFAVHVDSQLTAASAQKHAREFGLTLPVLIDAKHELVSAAGITRTPEVAVFIPDGTLAYRGRIDDRYASFGKKRIVPTQRDLRDALTAIAAGEAVLTTRTEAVGCSVPDLH
ncbi:MAG: redoxin family protein [Pirellula sp.]